MFDRFTVLFAAENKSTTAIDKPLQTSSVCCLMVLRLAVFVRDIH